MGALDLNYGKDKYTKKYIEIYDYLTEDTDFWLKRDVWTGKDSAFIKSKIPLQERAKTRVIADFTTFKNESLKLEMKRIEALISIAIKTERPDWVEVFSGLEALGTRVFLGGIYYATDNADN